MSKPSSAKILPIRLKLLSATIVSGLLALLIATGGLYCMHLMNQRLKEVVDVAAEKVKLSNLLRQDFLSVLRSERNMLLSSDEKEVDRLATTMDTVFDSIDQHVAQIRLVIEDENKKQLDEFVNKFSQWKTNHEKIRLYSGLDSQRQARELSMGEGQAAFDAYESLLNQLARAITNQPEEKVEKPEPDGPAEQLADSNSQTKAAEKSAKASGNESNDIAMTLTKNPAEPAGTKSKSKKNPNTNPKSKLASKGSKANKGAANAANLNSKTKTKLNSNPHAKTKAKTNSATATKDGKKEEQPSTQTVAVEKLPKPKMQSMPRDAKLRLISALLRDSLKFQRAEKNLVLEAHVDTAQADEQLVDYQQRIQSRVSRLKTAVTAAQPADAESLELVDAAEKKLNQYLATNTRIQKVVERKGGMYNYHRARLRGTPLAKDCEACVNQLAYHSEISMDNYEQESSSLYRSFRRSLLFLSLIAVAAGVVISIFVGGNVAMNIRKLSDYAKRIHLAKDLTRPVPEVSNDEIGELATAFDEMRDSLLNQNNRLASLNETLEQKSDEMEQFVYSVSHDLKSPLVSCKGLVGLINEDIADGQIDEALQSAERLSSVTDQMGDTIDDLLTFSRLGRNEVHLQTVDVDQLLHEIRDEWRERFEQVGVKFEIQPNMPAVESDVISLRRVFENLIGNALKYGCESESSVIEIGFERGPQTVTYFVRDNGPGIDPQYHEKIFGLFQRLDTSKNGSGIGLASAAKIIRHNRGRIWVESELGAGATFRLELPC